MRPRLAKATFEDCLYVARNMREWDKREIYATQWTEDPAELATQCMKVPEMAWTVHLDEPIAAFGAFQVWPGVFNVWFFATPRITEIGRWLTKFMLRVWIPHLKQDHGAKRAHCMSMEGHEDAQRWIELLGAKRESTQFLFGKNGETFYCYVWFN